MAATATKSPIATITLDLAKETKNTYQFKAQDESAAIPVVYVTKDTFDSEPTQITLTLS